MLATLLLLLVCLCTYFILLRTGAIFKPGLESIAAAIPIAMGGFALVTSVLSIFFSTLFSAGIVLIFFLILGIISYLHLRKKKSPFWQSSNFKVNKTLFLLSTFLFFYLCALVARSLWLKTGAVVVPEHAGADVFYHLYQAMRIGKVSDWHFQEPNFSGEFIRYPFFINLISGIMIGLKVNIFVAFQVPIFLLNFSIVYLLYAFIREMGCSKWYSVLAMAVVLFGGSLAYLNPKYWQVQLVRFPLQNLDYTGLVHLLTVQRPFALGLPLFLLAALAIIRGLKNENLSSLKWAGIIAAILPFAHLHSFFALTFFVLGVLLYLIITKNPLFFDFVRGFIFYSIFFVFLEGLALLILPKFNLGGIPALRLGWMSNVNEVGGINLNIHHPSQIWSWLSFIWTNFGLLLILPFVVLIYFRKIKDNLEFKLVALGALLAWLIPNVVQLQTWDLDTNKFFIYAVLMSVIAIGILFSKNLITKWFKILIIAVFLLSLPLGLILSYRVLAYVGPTVRIFTPDQKTAANWLVEHTSEDATVLTSAYLNSINSLANPVAAFAGRSSTLGYSTWTYTHGIDYLPREIEVQDFLSDPLNKNALGNVPLDYIVIDPELRKANPGLLSRLEAANYRIVYQNSTIQIVRITSK